MKVRGYLWNEATGNPQNAVDVDLIKREPSGSDVDTTTSDSDGMFEFVENGNPYGIVDVLIDDPGGYRRMFGDVSLMRTGFWFDAELIEMLAAVDDGVVPNIGDEYVLTAPGGMNVQIGTGLLKIKEAPCRYYSSANFVISANATGSPRVDGIFARLIRTGDDAGKTEIVRKTGDIIPEQDTDTWELLLYTVTVPNGAAAVTSGMITDVRPIASYPLSGIDADDIGAGTVDNTEYGYLNGVTGPIQTQLNGKAATSHTHTRAGGFSATIGDGVNVIPTGYYMVTEIPKDITITAGSIRSDVATTCSCPLLLEGSAADWDTSGTPWEDPTDVISGSNHPALTAAVYAAYTLTGWDTTWQASQFLIVKVASNSAARQLTFSFRYNESI